MRATPERNASRSVLCTSHTDDSKFSWAMCAFTFGSEAAAMNAEPNEFCRGDGGGGEVVVVEVRWWWWWRKEVVMLAVAARHLQPAGAAPVPRRAEDGDDERLVLLDVGRGDQQRLRRLVLALELAEGVGGE